MVAVVIMDRYRLFYLSLILCCVCINNAAGQAPSLTVIAETTSSISVRVNLTTSRIVRRYCADFRQSTLYGAPNQQPAVTRCNDSLGIITLVNVDSFSTYLVTGYVRFLDGTSSPHSSPLALETMKAAPDTPSRPSASQLTPTTFLINVTLLSLAQINGPILYYEILISDLNLTVGTMHRTVRFLAQGMFYNTTESGISENTYAIAIRANNSMLSNYSQPAYVTLRPERPPPHVVLRVTSVTIYADFILPDGISKSTIETYCVEFTQLPFSAGQTPAPPSRVCNNSMPVVLRNAKSYALYTATGEYILTNFLASIKSSIVQARTLPARPGQPSKPILISVTAKTISISWTALPQSEHNGILSGYRIEYRDPSLFIRFAQRQLTSINLFNLKPKTAYTIQILAVNQVGMGPPSPPLNVTTLTEPPTPTVTTVALTATSISVRVNVAANNVAMYCANFSRVALHGMYSPQAGVVQCRNTSGTITQEDLHPFALYHIRGYVLFDDNSSSALSTIVGLTTLKAAPDTPSRPAVTQLTPTTFSINVTLLSLAQINGPILYYEILIRDLNATSGAMSRTIRFLAQGMHYNTSESGISGNSYAIAIRANNSMLSNYSQPAYLTLSPLELPILTVAVNKSAVTINFTFPSSLRTNGPEVVCINFTRALLSSEPSPLASALTCRNMSSQVTLTGIPAAATYNIYGFYFVGGTQSLPSTIRNFTTPEIAPLMPPAPNITNIGMTSYTVTWHQVPLESRNGVITTYTVQTMCVSDSNSRGISVPADMAFYAVTIASLPVYEQCFSALKVKNRVGGISHFSASTSATTLQAEPGPPVVTAIANPTVIVTKQNVTVRLFQLKRFIIRLYKGSGVLPRLGQAIRQEFTTSSQQVLANLNHTSVYTVVVEVENTQGLIGNETYYIVNTSAYGPSAAPTGLTILTRGVDFLELSWNSVSFHNLNGVGLGYQVSFYTVSNHTGPMTVFRSINSTIGTFRGLMFGTTYTVQVAATTDQGTGNFSSPVFDTTLQSSPPAPVMTITTSSTSVAIIFKASGQFFLRQYCATVQLTNLGGVVPANTSTSLFCFRSANGTIDLYRLIPNATYSISGRTENTAGGISPPRLETFTTPPLPPTTIIVTTPTAATLLPAPIIAARANSSVVQVHFSLSTAYNVSMYCVNFTRLTLAGMADPLDGRTECRHTSEVVLSGLDAFANYSLYAWLTTFTMQAGQLTATNVTTTATPPTAPQHLGVRTLTSNSITVFWTRLPPSQHHGLLTGYEVQYGDATPPTIVQLGLITEYTITGLQPDTNYSVRVAAKNLQAGLGPSSGAILLTTRPLNITTAPIPVTPTVTTVLTTQMSSVASTISSKATSMATTVTTQTVTTPLAPTSTVTTTPTSIGPTSVTSIMMSGATSSQPAAITTSATTTSATNVTMTTLPTIPISSAATASSTPTNTNTQSTSRTSVTASVSAVTTPAARPAPRNITARFVSDNTLEVSWMPPPTSNQEPLSYNVIIYRFDANQQNPMVALELNVSATNRTLNLTVLPGFGYAVAVVALFRNVESGLIESSRPNLNISNLGESNAVLTVQPTTGTSTGTTQPGETPTPIPQLLYIAIGAGVGAALLVVVIMLLVVLLYRSSRKNTSKRYSISSHAEMLPMTSQASYAEVADDNRRQRPSNAAHGGYAEVGRQQPSPIEHYAEHSHPLKAGTQAVSPRSIVMTTNQAYGCTVTNASLQDDDTGDYDETLTFSKN